MFGKPANLKSLQGFHCVQRPHGFSVPMKPGRWHGVPAKNLRNLDVCGSLETNGEVFQALAGLQIDTLDLLKKHWPALLKPVYKTLGNHTGVAGDSLPQEWGPPNQL